MLAVLFVVILGCGSDTKPGEAAAIVPEPLSDHACAVCGMLVRDQPAPRGQVVHRDGERAFTCSVADLLAYLQAPSPHGAASAVFVEVLPPDANPIELHTDAHEWTQATSAAYVVGIERAGIMGEPVLAYREAESAGRAAVGPDTTTLDFTGLQSWWRDLTENGAAPPHQ